MNNEEKYIVPSATFTEQPSEYELKVQIPGIAKADAELHMEGKTLSCFATDPRKTGKSVR